MLMAWEQKLCILEYSCRCVAVVMFINKSLINGMAVDFIVVDFMRNILIIFKSLKGYSMCDLLRYCKGR